MPGPASLDTEESPESPCRKRGKLKVPRLQGSGVRTPTSELLERNRKNTRTAAKESATLSALLGSAKSSMGKTTKKRGEEGLDAILNYIKCIMYTFGDVQVPLESATAAVASVLLTQLKLAYRIATNAKNLRDPEDAQVQALDVVVAYRHNFPLLYRVYKRLSNRSEARRVARDITQPEAGDKVLRELKEALEQTHKGDLEQASAPTYKDQLYLSRLIRMDQQTQKMDQKEYLDFHRARSVSFLSSSAAKRAFQETTSRHHLSKLSSSAVELLATIAYETVARITEEATHIRGTDERPPPKFCKPQFRNPVLCEGDGTVPQLIPQSQLKRFCQYGLDRDDVEKAARKLTEESTQESHGIKEMKDVRLF